MSDPEIPDEAVQAAREALTNAVCICKHGSNQYGPWYTPLPTCPRCGDSEALAKIALAAALPALRQQWEAEKKITSREPEGEAIDAMQRWYEGMDAADAIGGPQ